MAICWPTRSDRNRTACRRAFTIVESLVALAITGASLIAVIGALRIASEATDRMRDAHHARLLAERRMVDLLQNESTSLGDSHGIEGKFVWTQQVQSSRVEGVAEVSVVVQWSHQGRPQTFELASLRRIQRPGGG